MKILRRDGDHILVQSNSRPGKVAHTLEKIDGQWVCSCEAANYGNKFCSHVKEISAMEKKRKI